MGATDAYYDARNRLVRAILARDEAAALEANDDARRLMLDWMALLTERLDSRNAGMLVDMLRQLDAVRDTVATLAARVTNLEALMGAASDDHGHDDTGRP